MTTAPTESSCDSEVNNGDTQLPPNGYPAPSRSFFDQLEKNPDSLPMQYFSRSKHFSESENGAGAAGESDSVSQGCSRSLNVSDALTFLNQVKICFADRPEVYNSYLDIMKDFKSQAIDTLGVIERVSILFQGYPNLIQGFSTILPPGYQINCLSDPSDPKIIRITTPAGTTTTSFVGLEILHVRPTMIALLTPCSLHRSPHTSHY